MLVVLMLLGCWSAEAAGDPCAPSVEETKRMAALAFNLEGCSRKGTTFAADYPDSPNPAAVWATCGEVYAEACKTHEGIRLSAAAGVTEHLPCRNDPAYKAAYGETAE